ncbi:MAG: TIGR02266 family protein [Proteobacteria bacterium]|jgi:type IV pilus assembly protein PilZ|nr:TIGR02266 family protein [Pseudomonadota bacterium]
MANEKRTSERISARVQVEYKTLDDFLEDYCSNLSMGGMFIETNQPLPINTRFRLRFHVPGRQPAVDTEAIVMWVNDKGSLKKGMGVAFDELAANDKQAVEEWLRQWE